MNLHPPISHENYPDAHHGTYSKTIFGFWLYLLTDFVMFATFFATYAVLYNNTYGGPPAKEIFNLQFALFATLALITASFTSGLGNVFAHRGSKRGVITFFIITFLLGILFIGLEYSELSRLVAEGNSWQKSAFLSAFYTLVGMHALHMFFALLWVVVLLIPVIKEGVTEVSLKRLTCLRMFWQFLGIIWIFIFTIVYLMGAV